MNKSTIIVISILAVAALGYYLFNARDSKEVVEVKDVASFQECVDAGNPVMESYPRQCRSVSGELFVENIGNELEKRDLIQLESPRPNQVITSPLKINGVARGYWFFEASFPVTLTNWDGLIIAQHFATAEGDWMTEDLVPFTLTLEFESPYKSGNPDL